METIRTESKMNYNIALDLDKMRDRYFELSEDKELKVELPAFEISAYNYNFFLLLSESKLVKFKPEWTQRPDYVSKEFYGLNIFWTLILYVNRIHCIEDFTNLAEILIPPYNVVLNMSKDRVSYNPKEIGVTESKDYKLYKYYPLDEREMDTINAKRVLNTFPIPEPPPPTHDIIILDGGINEGYSATVADGEE